MELLNTIKANSITNQTIDPIGGGIISNKVILPMGEFGTSVLMNYLIGKSYLSKWGNPYGYPKEILGRNAHMHIITWCLALVIIWIIYHIISPLNCMNLQYYDDCLSIALTGYVWVCLFIMNIFCNL